VGGTSPISSPKINHRSSNQVTQKIVIPTNGRNLLFLPSADTTAEERRFQRRVKSKKRSRALAPAVSFIATDSAVPQEQTTAHKTRTDEIIDGLSFPPTGGICYSLQLLTPPWKSGVSKAA
jgi:hypothetical protein